MSFERGRPWQSISLTGATSNIAPLFLLGLLISAIPGSAQNSEKTATPTLNLVSHGQFRRRDFYEISIRNSHSQFVNVQGSDFSGDRITSSEISNFDFSNTKLRGAILDTVELSNTKMQNVFAEGIRIQHSVLTEVNWQGAHLKDALFIRSSCHGCNFGGADLTGAVFLLCDLRHSTFDMKTQLPFTKATAEKMGLHFETK